jgi:hypothetical protein
VSEHFHEKGLQEHERTYLRRTGSADVDLVESDLMANADARNKWYAKVFYVILFLPTSGTSYEHVSNLLQLLLSSYNLALCGLRY